MKIYAVPYDLRHIELLCWGKSHKNIQEKTVRIIPKIIALPIVTWRISIVTGSSRSIHIGHICSNKILA